MEKQFFRQRKGKAYDWPGLSSFPLIKTEEEKIGKLAKKLKKEKIDIIYSSDSLRAKQTAEIVSRELGLKVNFDSRLRDINFGIYQGRKREEYWKDFPVSLGRFKKRIPEGESWLDIKKRMVDFIKDIDEKYENKKILIVSHGDPLWLLEGALSGLTSEELLTVRKKIIEPES